MGQVSLWSLARSRETLKNAARFFAGARLQEFADGRAGAELL
jgi:hypothetical protein